MLHSFYDGGLNNQTWVLVVLLLNYDHTKKNFGNSFHIALRLLYHWSLEALTVPGCWFGPALDFGWFWCAFLHFLNLP